MAGSSSLSRGWTKGFYVTEDTFTDLASVGVASRKLHDYLERLFPFSLFYLIPGRYRPSYKVKNWISARIQSCRSCGAITIC